MSQLTKHFLICKNKFRKYYCPQCEYSKELEVKNKKLDEIQVKLHNQIGSLNDTIVKLEGTNCDILSKYQAVNNENIVLKKVFLYFYYNAYVYIYNEFVMLKVSSF